MTEQDIESLWAQFGRDVEKPLPITANDEWYNISTDLDDAIKGALVLAIEREQERLLTQLRAVESERDAEEAAANEWVDICLHLVIKIHKSGLWSPNPEQTLGEQIQDAVEVLLAKRAAI